MAYLVVICLICVEKVYVAICFQIVKKVFVAICVKKFVVAISIIGYNGEVLIT